MPYDDYDEPDVYELIEQAYSNADNLNNPIPIVLDCYRKYEDKDALTDRVAEDGEALQWLVDYWNYVRWNEHGNESTMQEVGGFKGLARTVTDSDYVDATLNYLIYDDDPEQIDPTARDLADRLKNIANRYGALRKMNKSTDMDEILEIEDMIDDLIDELIANGEGKLSDDLFDVLRDFHNGDYEYASDVIHGIGNDSSSSEISEKADEIAERVRRCSKSTKKSQDIHSMIADIRKNNNSLKKSRVDLKFE